MLMSAFGFRISLEFILATCALVLGICAFVVLVLLRKRTKRLDWTTILTITFGIPLVIGGIIILFSYVHSFVTTPMKVGRWSIQGNYTINRDWFKVPNADWQYEHYRMRISNDTLYLNVMNDGKLIKEYRRVFHYIPWGKHTFIEFYSEYELHTAAWHQVRDSLMALDDVAYARFQEQSDTENLEALLSDSLFNVTLDSAKRVGGHHMLRLNPMLHADPFSFNVVLRSTRYGNMFFRKGEWKPLEQSPSKR